MEDADPLIQFADRAGVLDLSWGHPRPELLPTDAWADAVRAALATHGWRALTYGADPGPGPLIDWLAEHLRTVDGWGPEPGETFVTAGASHALALVSQVLVGPGDVVLVDAPTYHLAFPVLRDRGAELVPVPTDERGLVPAAIEEQVARLRRAGRRVPMLYLVPTFGNPTGRSLSDDRRATLVATADRAGVTIVEDDTYRELVYDGDPPPSLWSLAPDGGRSGPGRAVRLGSFAKTVAPGLRLGWVNAPPEFVGRLMRIGYVHSGGGVNHTTAVAMAEFGASGAYDTHLGQTRPAYRAQRDALAGALKSAGLDGDVPAGGWFLWRRLPAGLTAKTLLPVAERHGTAFIGGDQFFVDGTPGQGHIRLAFSQLATDELAEAAARLTAAVGAAASD